MKFEQAINKRNTERPALDADWYKRFEEIAAFQAYEYLDGDAATQAKEKESFLKREKENPELDYPLLDEEQLLMRYDELLDLKKKILEHEKNDVVKNVYRWRLNEKIAENRLLLAAATGDMRRFRRYSEFIYGKPSPEIAAYTFERVREEFEVIAEKKAGTPLGEEATRFLKSLPQASLQTSFRTPNNASLEAAQAATESSVGNLLHIPEGEETFDAEDIKTAFEESLKQLSAEGWIAVINPNKTNLSVNQESKTVNIPPNRTLLVDPLKRLIAHEIGTHAARRLNGERTKLKLLGLGLDRYEGGEEGIATLREQALAGKVDDFSGFLGHFSISLAQGLDGKPRNFREVFDILRQYNYVKGLNRDLDEEEAKKQAENNAWAACVRTFRGTDSKTPGVCFTKDIIYREGNIAVWETVERNQPEMHRWNIGKYDPSNPRHIWVLDQLGITDKDLVELSK